MAEKNEKCLHEAQKVYARMYSERKIYQKEKFQEHLISKMHALEIYSNFIALRTFIGTKSFFQYFGGLVHDVHLSFYTNTALEGREIVKYMNDYCYDSLLTLRLSDCKENVLDELKTPFKNVGVLRFSSNSIIVNKNAMKFTKLFPNLHTLMIDETNSTDWELIGANFPHLTELAIELPPANENNEFNEKPAFDIFSGEQKISDLSIKKPSLKLLKKANSLQLKNLRIKNLPSNYLNYDNDIKFDRLQYLTVDGEEQIPHKTLFSNISVLELIIRANFTDEWMAFLDTQINRELPILELDVKNIESEHLIRIADRFKNLTEAVIRCPAFFHSNKIATFLDKLENLEKFKIFNKMKINHHDDFKSYINGKWEILIESKHLDESSFKLVR